MNDDEKREATAYRVQKDFGIRSNVYRIDKLVMGVEVDNYHVTVEFAPGMQARIASLWCDCPGFRNQHFAQAEHKHVKLVLDYLERGAPGWAEYTLIGTGQKAKIKFLRSKS